MGLDVIKFKLTVGKHPGELAQNDQGLADPRKLHVHVDGGGDRVDQADQHNLQESLDANGTISCNKESRKYPPTIFCE
jgi:hypothetical protein